jgi:hypothetical protein
MANLVYLIISIGVYQVGWDDIAMAGGTIIEAVKVVWEPAVPAKLN